MAISTNYGILQKAVADGLGNRTDLLSPLSGSGLSDSPIKWAIQSAIAKWEREPFYFNEAIDTPLFTTVAGQELYSSSDAAAIASTPEIWVLHALISGNRTPLEKRSVEWMEDNSINPSARGQPSDWAYFAKQIRLYPIPDGAYPIRASRVTVLPAMSADTDANVWTIEGFDLIRSEAMLILARETLHDDDLANRMTIAIYGNPLNPRERGYLAALKAETMRRARTKIRATQF